METRSEYCLTEEVSLGLDIKLNSVIVKRIIRKKKIM
jgi:hypothetical protein